MMYFFGMLLAIAALYALVIGLIRTNPRDIIRAVRILVPTVLIVFALICAALGREGLGVILALLGGVLIWRMRKSGRRSAAIPVLRSPWLELQIETDTGRFEGSVLAGEFEGRELDSLSEAQLMSLYRALSNDPDSKALLEAYLDGRSPAWRGDAKTDADLGQRAAPSSGTMADEEAYQILGLQPGAGAADIRKSHRRLTQRMRGNGGATLLLNRIDEARNVLLARHN